MPMADPSMKAVGILCIALFQASVAAINVLMGPDDIRRATELARFPHTYSGSGDQRWLAGALVEAAFDVRGILHATQAVVVG